ncbi:MAG TPA: glucosamine-6-phosphate deaminase [Gemmatimonadaceae bacterium]|nr:glucosamine-6-phosphate deaminase [Gemmatimonadaceae bacterium]
MPVEARDKETRRGPRRLRSAPDAPVTPRASARERIPVVVLDDHDAIARAVAQRIAAIIRDRAANGRAAVLGLATGATPVGVYRELIRMHRDEDLSFANVVTFNLDEYYPIDPDSVQSYHRFMWENLFAHVNIPRENVHIPRGDVPRDAVAAEATAYEHAISEAGGIDFQILGIGKTGHIGFNEPGSGLSSRTRLVTLDTITRRDAAADFFGEENVPREAITMGVATILEAREIAILATGEHKAEIVRRAVEGEVHVDIAATFLQQHPSTTFYLDTAAAAELTAVAAPWLIDEVVWSDALALRAIVWLSLETRKGILKLEPRDYMEHKLSSLLSRFGAAGEANGFAFNALGAKIRGRSKLPHNVQVICFSPHPDDDVISMGGMLHKLVQNGNDVLVAYMTSGNIAVFDHDVRRYADFLSRLERTSGSGERSAAQLHDRVLRALESKRPGDIDTVEIQDIKRVIREAEAVSGIETLGLTRSAACFLNLPFYQTGKVRKDPIGRADVAIVRELLEQRRPDLIFVAGDLSDPHGTHRMCKAAIDQALAQLRAAGWREALPPNAVPGASARVSPNEDPPRLPQVWLYRGAWQEWPVTEATWLVPLSQEELHLKIQAIFKHQSQKDSAPFPGLDDREFWQRVDTRNRDTAALLDRLGLAEYFAMEAYTVA